MISEDLLDLLFCAQKEGCNNGESKRCVISELAYSHIACKPLQLECGHVICKSCEIEKPECFKHGKRLVASSNAYVWHYLFKEKQKELFALVVEQSKKVLNIINGNKK